MGNLSALLLRQFACRTCAERDASGHTNLSSGAQISLDLFSYFLDPVFGCSPEACPPQIQVIYSVAVRLLSEQVAHLLDMSRLVFTPRGAEVPLDYLHD